MAAIRQGTRKRLHYTSPCKYSDALKKGIRLRYALEQSILIWRHTTQTALPHTCAMSHVLIVRMADGRVARGGGGGGCYIFSQPTRLYRCARVVNNLVKTSVLSVYHV